MEFFRQKYFNGWVTENDRIGNSDQYLYGENIDTYTNPDFIQLSNKPSLSTSILQEPFNLVEITDRVSNTSKVVVLCEDNIYHEDSATPVYTNAAMNDLIYPAFVLWDYFWWVHSAWPTSAFSLNRTTVSDALSTSWTPSIWHLTLSNNNYFQYSSFVTIWLEAYISIGNIIEYIEYDASAGTYSTTPFDNLVADEIVGMATSYMGILIFTETGKVHVWDGVNNLLSETININIKPSKVYQYGTTIYLLSGGQLSEKWLYVFDGQTAVPLFKQNFSSQISEWKGRFISEIGSITNDRENLYLVDEANDSNERVSFYGAEVRGTKKGLHYINVSNSSWDDFTRANAILHSQGDLYIAWMRTWGTYGLDKISNTKNTSWYIITRVDDFDLWILRATCNGIYFRTKDIDSNHTIEVQASVDGWTYTSLRTISATPEKGIVRISMNEIRDAGISAEFVDISFKLIFTSNDSTSPKVYQGLSYPIEVNTIM